MDVHPFIAALRSDRAPQRKAQAAIDAARIAWREEPGAAEMTAELARYGAGAPLESCPQLEAMFTAQGEAERLASLLSRHYCAALRETPIGHPPFRNGYTGSAGTILLARAGRAQILLQFVEVGEHRAASYKFTDGTRLDAILAGEAEGEVIRARAGGSEDGRVIYDTEPLSLRAGARIALDLSSETLISHSVKRRLVSLRLSRQASDPEPSREYDAESGALLLQSAATIATSRQEAIIALLGRMGRNDAAPQIADIALSEGDPSLRWQALRECLALDTEAGFCTLSAIARRAEDPLAQSAGALRAQLIENHPELGQLESARCPA